MAGVGPELLLIGSDNPTTWIVYNRLLRLHGPFPAIIEKTVPRGTLIRNRARKLGWSKVLSQVAFVGLIRPLLRYTAAKRVKVLCKRHDLETRKPYTDLVLQVESINSPEALALMQQFGPRIVVVNGTRIIRKAVLQGVPATFINTHQGITPQYRGAHGGYWARYFNDAAHCGVTVHLVDEGIDTGNIVGQATIAPEPEDCFITYPYLQMAAALPILQQAITDLAADRLRTVPVSGPSAVWYHPGFFQYLAGRLRGVK
jgi:folate-dependent phosphoribosylglycinamide formyltransferase PurN